MRLFVEAEAAQEVSGFGGSRRLGGPNAFSLVAGKPASKENILNECEIWRQIALLEYGANSVCSNAITRTSRQAMKCIVQIVACRTSPQPYGPVKVANIMGIVIVSHSRRIF